VAVRRDGGDPDDTLASGQADTVASDTGESAPSTRTSATFAIGPGSDLGRYQLGDELGAGGMATVYRARDRDLRRDVAVKVLFPHLARKPELTQRFHREARAAAGLEHPNILRVYDVGADNATPYIVMELVRGHSLRELADTDAPMLSELVAAIGALLCDALAIAHGAGIIHRDIKPANVMIADDGRLLLADFGVARIEDDDSLVTRTGALLGTPSFMAPEQAHGRTVDGRSDLYSVGVTLYQLASGSLPFAGPTAKILVEAAKGAVAVERRVPTVGAPLSRLIERLMNPDPAHRPSDAATVATDLRRLVSDGGLGKPADELRDYALDRAGYRAQRAPTVIAALVDRAQAAAARGATAHALSLCDRILAMDARNDAATALAERLTRSDQRRRWLVVGGALLALTVAAGGGWMAVRHWGGRPSTNGPGTDAATTIATGPIDAGSIDDAPTIDGRGGVLADATTADARSPVIDASRRDASATPAPAVADARLIADAAVTDAMLARDLDAALAPGTITLSFDTWCDLSIDGMPPQRATDQPIELSPGRHRLQCRQGLGQGTWTETVTVAAGEHRTISGNLLAPVTVTNALADSVRIRTRTVAAGATISVRPGRIKVDIVRGGVVTGGDWVTVPAVAACTLRKNPDLDCVP
jgi:tRNA A-37 threonylcarbamoyl transferase component Bud32